MSEQAAARPNPALTFDTVVELLGVLDGSDLPTTIDFRDGGLRLKIRRGVDSVPAAPAVASAPVSATPTAAPATPAPTAEPTTTAPASGQAEDDTAPGQTVDAPIAGVFYRAPSPGADPFVEVGQRVTADDVIGIVEVMKLMNTVRAGVAGVVVAVGVEDGELVEFGQTLVRIDTEA